MFAVYDNEMEINLNLNGFVSNGNLGKIPNVVAAHSAGFPAAHIDVVQLVHWP